MESVIFSTCLIIFGGFITKFGGGVFRFIIFFILFFPQSLAAQNREVQVLAVEEGAWMCFPSSFKSGDKEFELPYSASRSKLRFEKAQENMLVLSAEARYGCIYRFSILEGYEIYRYPEGSSQYLGAEEIEAAANLVAVDAFEAIYYNLADIHVRAGFFNLALFDAIQLSEVLLSVGRYCRQKINFPPDKDILCRRASFEGKILKVKGELEKLLTHYVNSSKVGGEAKSDIVSIVGARLRDIDSLIEEDKIHSKQD